MKRIISVLISTLVLTGCAAQLTFIDTKDGKMYFGQTDASGSSGEATALIANVRYSGPWVYSTQGGGYTLGTSSFSGSAFSGTKSAFATGTGALSALSLSAQGSGLLNMNGADGSFMRCVFDFNRMSNSGIGKCLRNDGREFDLTIIKGTNNVESSDKSVQAIPSQSNQAKPSEPTLVAPKASISPEAIEWNEKSITSANNSQWAEAIRTATAAISIDSNYADAYTNRCRAYLGYGYLEDAYKDCEIALKLDPKNLTAINNRGAVLNQLGRQKDALADYEKACTSGYDLSCKNFERIKGYSPTDKKSAIKPLLEKASMEFAAQDWNGVIRSTSEAIEIDPNNAQAYITRSGAYANRGEIAKATSDIEKGVKLDPNDGVGYNNYGAILEMQGKIKQARLQFEIACGLNIKLGCMNFDRLK